MNVAARLNGLLAYQKALFAHLEANAAGMAGIAVLTSSPKIVDLAQAPLRISIEGLELDGLQCLGVAVLQKDRQARANDALSMAKRLLVCEALESAADFLARASRLVVSGADPCDEDLYFQSDVKDLWSAKIGRAGSLMQAGERDFFENCAAPLRSCIRYYNGRLYPEKNIQYAGRPGSRSINVSFEWQPNASNEIILQLSAAYDIFISIREITASGLENALHGLKI